MKQLITHGADQNRRDHEACTPLHYSVYAEYDLGLRLLLAPNAKVDNIDCYGYTALLSASKMGKTQHVRALVNHGAELNVKNRGGFTALANAVGRNYVETVMILVSKGADRIDVNSLDNRTFVQQSCSIVIGFWQVSFQMVR